MPSEINVNVSVILASVKLREQARELTGVMGHEWGPGIGSRRWDESALLLLSTSVECL